MNINYFWALRESILLISLAANPLAWFFKFDSYIKKYTEIHKAFYSIVAKVLCIRYTYDLDQGKLSQALQNLNTLLEKKLEKKIIFITKDIMRDEWDKNKVLSDKIYDGESADKYYKFTLNDLSEPSQEKLLTRAVEIQGHQIRLNELIDSRDKNAKQIINTEPLVKLIKNKKITIGSYITGTSDLAGAYTQLHQDINTERLINNLLLKDNNIFVISGIKGSKKRKSFIDKLKSLNTGLPVDNIDQNQISDFRPDTKHNTRVVL